MKNKLNTANKIWQQILATKQFKKLKKYKNH